ncbi:MAG: hypothetical protein ABIL58_12870 [Pseudomonadota bacterium]
MKTIGLLLTLAVFLTGCGTPLKSPITLSRGLDYLSKSNLGKFKPQVKPGPGMLLVTTSIALKTQYENSISALPAAFRWKIPSPQQYARKDFLLLTSMVSAAKMPFDETGNPFDAVVCMREIGQNMRANFSDNPEDFFQAYAEKVIGKAINSMKLEFSTPDPSDKNSALMRGTPSWYRYLATEGQAIDFEAKDCNSTIFLEFEVPVPKIDGDTNQRCVNSYKQATFFNFGNDPFFTRPPMSYSECSDPPYPNVWLGSPTIGLQSLIVKEGSKLTIKNEGNEKDIKGNLLIEELLRLKDTVVAPRAVLELKVPIRLVGQAGYRYIPFYYSVADIERDLGITVMGLSRRDRYFPYKHEDNPDITYARQSDGSRFEIRFCDGYEIVWTNKHPLVLPKLDKENTLVAAEDIVIWQAINDNN